MFITFEGIDGSGKSTQIELLKKALKKSGYKADVFREPGGTDLSEMIRGILLNTEININPVTEVLLFSASRSQLIAERVQPLLNEGRVVILDRFYDSTTAYQGYGRESMPLEQIGQINNIASHGLEPDITLYLKLSPEESENRTRHLHKDRIEKEGETFFKRVYEGFEELSRKHPRFKTIDAAGTAGEVHKRIIDALQPYFNMLVVYK